MKYAVLGSGSGANSYIFEENNFSFIVDNGFAMKEFEKRVSDGGFNIDAIKFIFLTHKHADHFKGVGVLSKNLKIPVIMGKDVKLDKTESHRLYKIVKVDPDSDCMFEDLTLSVFPLSHDSLGAVSCSFTLGNRIFTIITDTGKISGKMEEYALKSNVLFLEANYCCKMLKEGSYAPWLKARIQGSNGHLSNDDAIDFLLDLHKKRDSEKLENYITYLCHISDKNNDCEILEKMIKSKLPETFRYKVCPKGEYVGGENG